LTETPIAAAMYRGETVESLHRAHAVVADPSGRVLASVGDPSRVAFTRSSIKAYQLAPLIASGAADRFGFDEREIAVMCSSHSGEPMHVELVQGILQKIGLGVDALQCGVDLPFDPQAAKALKTPPTALHNNCSGKHSGLLAQAVALKADPKTYLDPQYPVQVRIKDLVARAAGVSAASIPLGTDGCSAPNFALTIQAGARLFANLARPTGLDPKEARALDRIRAAMMQHPELVAGSDRFDTRLMRAAPGRLACKIGGEAVFGVANPELGLGLYLKIEDGAMRAVPPVVCAALESLGWLKAPFPHVLERDRVVPVKNVRGTIVGRIEPRIRLPSLASVPAPRPGR
jgi:L-asparaginase II